MVEATRRMDLDSQGNPSIFLPPNPSIVLTPNPANPGAFVYLNGTGFVNGPSECSISSSSPILFQGPVECFAGDQGNITGIFQVNTLAAQGAYVVLVTDQTLDLNKTYPEQYANASFSVIHPLPPAIELVTKTVSTTIVTTSRATITETSTSTTTREIRSEITLPQAIVVAATTAAVTAVAARIYVSQKGATIRMDQRARTKRRPGFAFDVEVRSGIDREESSR